MNDTFYAVFDTHGSALKTTSVEPALGAAYSDSLDLDGEEVLVYVVTEGGMRAIAAVRAMP